MTLKTKKMIALLFTILSLSILSFVLAVHKSDIEHSNQVVEYVLSYDNVKDVLSRTGFSEQELFDKLSETPIGSFSFNKNTLQRLEDRGFISLMDHEEMNALKSLLGDYELKTKEKSYVLIYDRLLEKDILSSIQARFDPQHIKVEDTFKGYKLITIEEPIESVEDLSLPYINKELSEFFSTYDYRFIPIIENDWEDKESLIVNQVKQLGNAFSISKVLYQDGFVLGYPNTLNVNRPFSTIGVASMEFVQPDYPSLKQVGMESLSPHVRDNVVRTHAIKDGEMANYFNTNRRGYIASRIVRAVEERNIRLVYIEFPTEPGEQSIEHMFEESLAQIKKSQERLIERGYSIGYATRFIEKDVSLYATYGKILLVLFSLLCFIFLSFLFKSVPLRLVTTSLIMMTSLTVLFTDSTILFDLYSLMIGSVVSLFSISLFMKYVPKDKTCLMTTTLYYIGITFITIILAFVLPATHNSLYYALYLEQFKGVRLMHILPMILMVFILLKNENITIGTLLTFIKKPIRIWHVLLVGFVLLFLLAAGYIYLTRTGNHGTLLPFEASFRSWLEETFGVRPRTKEAFIAHPLLFVILYYYNRFKPIRYLLPFAIIGQLSIVNTFTHFHTPLSISLTRSLTGCLVGLIVGLLFYLFSEFFLKKGFLFIKNR